MLTSVNKQTKNTSVVVWFARLVWFVSMLDHIPRNSTYLFSSLNAHTNTHCTLSVRMLLLDMSISQHSSAGVNNVIQPPPLVPAAWGEVIRNECYAILPVRSNMPVFVELLHEDLWLNGIKMTVEGLELQSEVLQQSFPVLRVCVCSVSWLWHCVCRVCLDLHCASTISP